jgi:rare lipoprotein A
MKRHLIVFRKHQKSVLISALMLAIGVLSGCASDPPKLNVPIAKEGHHKRSYNRPYRVKGKMYYPITHPSGYSEVGLASWYGSESGSKTSMGTRFWPEGSSAAHKTLPLPSKVRVTNLHNGQSVVLTVNDRGPFKPNRLIDLSHGAARKIGLCGLAKVKVDYLGIK